MVVMEEGKACYIITTVVAISNCTQDILSWVKGFGELVALQMKTQSLCSFVYRDMHIFT